ncbi:hypothetical protein ACIBKY_32880 [Nonomuraea sp. NPDC050394]|uniref:hypothetical protein n=1 Tax=Nonomuraea sp. NPDC050394 TaxID=3364363 RepID=UPI0037B991ED
MTNAAAGQVDAERAKLDRLPVTQTHRIPPRIVKGRQLPVKRLNIRLVRPSGDHARAGTTRGASDFARERNGRRNRYHLTLDQRFRYPTAADLPVRRLIDMSSGRDPYNTPKQQDQHRVSLGH